MTDHPLFAYGTLQDADILGAVLGGAIAEADPVPASLADFAAVFYPGRVYPALIARPGAHAAGRLVGGLGALDWAALDAFEGEEYRRGLCAVDTARGPVTAHVYLPVQPIGEEARPWTLAFWRAHHKAEILAEEITLARAARQGAALREPGA